MQIRRSMVRLAVPLIWTLAGPVPADAEVARNEKEPVSAEEPPAPSEAAAQQVADSAVGTIEMSVDGQRKVFDVREGSPRQGFSTGYSVRPRGEALVVGVGLHGWDRNSDAEILVTVAFWRESLEHMCDPFSNQVRFEGRRMRPGDRTSETCPPPPDGGHGGLALHIDLTEASIDEEQGTVHVAGTFSGPLGRGDDALQVTEGRFEGTVRPYEELEEPE